MELKNLDAHNTRLMDIFDSIVCLAVEGPEFHTKLELMKAIEKEAIKGYVLCKNLQIK